MATFQPGQIQSLKSQGYSDDQIQQLQQMDLTSTDWSSLGLGMSGGQQIQPTIGATGTGGTPTPQQQLGQREAAAGGTTGALTRMILNQQGGKQQGPAPPTDQQLFSNPLYAGNALGAAALQMPMVVNPQPSGQPSAKSGVAAVPQPIVSQGVPVVPGAGGPLTWNQLASANQLGSADIAELQKTGLSPDQFVQGTHMGLNLKAPQPTQALAGPWTNPQIGSVFTPVARTAPTMALGATPIQAAAQPTAIAYNPAATPFAQAPPAPGIQIPQAMNLAAGTPQMSGQPAPYTGTVHDDPYMSHAVSAMLGLPSNPWHPPSGGAVAPGVTALAAAPQPTAAKKMQSGGLVPGRGNEDKVPALLTPGEYVIPKDQVPGYLKMQSGGVVPDPDPDPNAPPEARRKTLTTPTPPTQPSQPSSSSSSAPAAPAQSPAAAQHIMGGLANLYGGGGGIPAGSTAGAGASGTVGSYMAGQGSAGAAGSLGKLPAGGLSSPGAQSALGGISSGLGQAAQAIASSAPPWQMQQNAIPAPPPAPAAPQFTQPPAPQQTQQGVNPYAAYAMNQAGYPTSPYYT